MPSGVLCACGACHPSDERSVSTSCRAIGLELTLTRPGYGRQDAGTDPSLLKPKEPVHKDVMPKHNGII